MALLKAKLPGDSEESQVRMGFGEHIEEFRRRLIFALGGSAIGVALCLYYIADIISFILRPYLVALKLAHFPATLLSTGMAEVFMNYLSIGVKAGLVISSPWIIYQIWLFVAAGLYARERRIVYRYIGPSIVLFFSGAAFFFFFVLPLASHFLLTYTLNTNVSTPVPNSFENWIWNPKGGETDFSKLPDGNNKDVVFPLIPIVKSDPTTFPTDRLPIWYNAVEQVPKARVGNQTMTFLMHPENSLFTQFPKLNEYLDFVIFACLIFGLCFELPMVMLVLAQIGIVEAAWFRKVRKYAYFGIAVFSCIAAPSGDIFTMIAMVLPMVGLYELGIVLAAITGKKREEAESS